MGNKINVCLVQLRQVLSVLQLSSSAELYQPCLQQTSFSAHTSSETSVRPNERKCVFRVTYKKKKIGSIGRGLFLHFYIE